MQEVLTTLQTRVRKNPYSIKHITSLYNYLTKKALGSEFRGGLQKKPETLADLCAALMNFAVECERLTQIVQDLRTILPSKRQVESESAGKSGNEKS